jgi:DNA-binding MarR family transcriptional regulator
MPDHLGAAASLVRLSFLVQSIYAEVADKHGLTVAHAQLLCVINETPRGMSELAGMLRLEKSSLSGLVDRAEARGLLARRSEHDDRRSTLVSLTSVGLPLAEAFHSEVTQRLEIVVQMLPSREERRFTELASKLVLAEQIPAVFGESPLKPAAQPA